MLPRGDEESEDGAETARDPGRNRDIRILKCMRERFDECDIGGLLDATVAEDAEAGDRAGVEPMPVEDVELDVGGLFKEDRTGAGEDEMRGDVTRGDELLLMLV